MGLVVNYLLSLGVFILFSWFFIYLPGFRVVDWLDKKTRGLDRLVLSLSLGMVLFVAFHLLIGWLNLRFLSWPVYGLVAILTWRDKKKWAGLNQPARFKKWAIKKKGWFKLILLVGVLIQLWINVFSGWLYQEGVLFWSAHGHDAPWHGGLMRELAERFPPRFRLMSGSKLENYHYFVDILMGEFHRLGGFDPMDLYFRHFTLLFASLFLLLGFCLVRKWKDESSGLWTMFFMALSGSFGYLVSLLQNGNIYNSEAKFWVSQIYTAIGNPPQMMAFIVFMTFLYLLLGWLKKPQLKSFWILVILSGLMPGFKVYASATLLGGLGLLAVVMLWRDKNWRGFSLFGACTLSAAITFFSNTSGGSSFLVFQPWWFIRTMVVAGDRLGWKDLELRRQFYLDLGGWRGWFRVIHMEALALVIFAVGNLGTKALGLVQMARSLWTKNKKPLFDLFLIFATLVCFVFPQIFVQRGVAWNTAQFFQYYLLLVAFFAGIFMAQAVEKKNFLARGLMVLGLLIFSVPTVIASLIFFVPGNALALVSNEELVGLNFLQEMTDPGAVVAVSPFDGWAWEQFDQPRPIYTWDDTSYVSYYSNRETYVADAGQVEIMGYEEGKKRVEAMRNFFVGDWHPDQSYSPSDARKLIEAEGIDYFYLVYNQKFRFVPEEMGLESVFENGVVRIYKVNR